MERGIDDGEVRKVTWFLFVGDMLVMLFMCVLVVWVYLKSTAEVASAAARIPLEDEYSDD
jgi:cbb3-type cytochrome oxidase subunit 3